mmetsp:Transcript_3490/g.13315  ORF Transcript_3490/g.13315 Transcript_3490/m.13315 type:complete len:233 (-) Transcript_3490:584-1282(-)
MILVSGVEVNHANLLLRMPKLRIVNVTFTRTPSQIALECFSLQWIHMSYHPHQNQLTHRVATCIGSFSFSLELVWCSVVALCSSFALLWSPFFYTVYWCCARLPASVASVPQSTLNRMFPQMEVCSRTTLILYIIPKNKVNEHRIPLNGLNRFAQARRVSMRHLVPRLECVLSLLGTPLWAPSRIKVEALVTLRSPLRYSNPHPIIHRPVRALETTWSLQVRDSRILTTLDQ